MLASIPFTEISMVKKGYKMPVKISETDWAYIAGVIDSDGYVGLTRSKENRRTKNTYNYRPTITVTQAEPQAVVFIKNIGLGTFGINRQQNKKHRSLFRWGVYSYMDVRFLIENILPYLRIKREQARILLEYCEHRENIMQKKANCKKDPDTGKFIASSKTTYTGEEKVMWQKIKRLNQIRVAK